MALLEEGATVPFIARYRKDKTGALDEVQIQAIKDEVKAIKEFQERKATIEKSITEQGKMTDGIQSALYQAETMTELEDIYLPYKPKRKTKAQTARENGLGPLADLLLLQDGSDLEAIGQSYINEKIGSLEEALQGARDIIAEQVSEDIAVRARVRKHFENEALFQSKVAPEKEKEQETNKYKDYFDFNEPIHKIPSHRILAVLRGFLEGHLRLGINPPNEEDAIALMEDGYVKSPGSFAGEQVKKAIKDGYRRLLQPGLETEFRSALKAKADEEAINVFAENVKQLLLSAPLGSKRLLAIDPGYRTGCKTVCLDENGNLLKTSLFYLHEGGKRPEGGNTIKELVATYKPEVIAVGDGTAGRETEQFLKTLELGLPIYMVNEDGASIYSASETAREEFPNEDITVRGSVSIGRRLMDPLAELVKIDAKSIGVGQYQHDVNQARLKEKLDQTVESCVNLVGVNINTASKNLLSYVSGIGPSLAENIIKFRNEKGQITNRSQLLKVPRLGAKAYEQCAGFLRISNGENPLDASAVHPEAYPIVETIAKDLRSDIKSLIGNEKILKAIDPRKYATDTIGVLTIKDVLKELIKPGLDPRKPLEHFEFAQIYKVEDVKEGMVVPGIVTNITRFGAFIDIGVKQDGLVHVSEITDRYINDPSVALKLNDKVVVRVMEIDPVRKRIALSIKQAKEPSPKKEKREGERTKNESRPNVQKTNGKQEKNVANAETEKEINMEDALLLLKQKFGKHH